MQSGEQCDDGNSSNSDACLNTCLPASCGDGFVRTGVEQCDDGNTSNTDGCVGSCKTATCGDGFVRAGVEVIPAPVDIIRARERLRPRE
jgi:cysteine-rich repeat protein